MRILGIDPGYALLGYGVVESVGTKLAPIDYGVIETKPDEAFPERLLRLYDGMNALLSAYRPDAAAFEGEKTCLTWRQLHDTAKRIGTYLARQLPPRVPVALCMDKSPMTVAAMRRVSFSRRDTLPSPL